MAQDVETVLAGQHNGLDDGAGVKLAGQVPRLAVDLHRHDIAVALEQGRSRGALLDDALGAVEGDGQLLG